MRMIGRTTAATTRRGGGIALGLGLALAAGVAWSLPATAAPAAAPAVEYSLDGVHWSAQPPASVFDASWVPVPGTRCSSRDEPRPSARCRCASPSPIRPARATASAPAVAVCDRSRV